MTQLWIELWLFVYIPFRTLSVWCASKWDVLELVTLQYPTTYFVNLTKSAKTSGILLKKKYWVSVVGASFIFFQGFSLEKFGLWEMVLCYQNCSDLLWEKKMFKLLRKKYEIRGWRPRICKLFEISRTNYSNSERSEIFLVTKCFFNLFLDISHV